MHHTARMMNRRLMFNGDPITPDPNNPGSAGGGTPGKTLTQDQVNSIVTREKSQAAQAEQTRILQSLGFESLDAAQAAIQAQQTAERERMSAVERREADAAAKESAAAERERKAALREQAAARREALVGLGATGDNLADAVVLLGGSVADDADEAALSAAATALRERRPELFGAPPTLGGGTTTPPAAPSTLPPNFPPANPGPQTTSESKGLARARQMFGEKARIPGSPA